MGSAGPSSDPELVRASAYLRERCLAVKRAAIVAVGRDVRGRTAAQVEHEVETGGHDLGLDAGRVRGLRLAVFSSLVINLLRRAPGSKGSPMHFIRDHRYPSDLWGRELARILRSLPCEPGAIIVDAPAGDGVITYWLIREGVRHQFQLVDISPAKTADAQKLTSWAQARGVAVWVVTADLAEAPLPGGADDVWLLVNSLFMFERADEIVQRMRPCARFVVGLFPVISHPDYLRYTSRHPEVNEHAMNETETEGFFAEHGYALRSRQDITYIPTRWIRPNVLRQALRLVISPLEHAVPKRHACYWIGVFERNRF